MVEIPKSKLATVRSPLRGETRRLLTLIRFLREGKTWRKFHQHSTAQDPIAAKQTTSQQPLSRQQAFFQDSESRNHYLLLACTPKSGSTYLSTILENLPNFKRTSLVSFGGRREQEIEQEKILANAGYNFVAQHHVRFSEATAELIRLHNLKPILLVRDIFDSIVSFRDHIRQESVIFPMAYALPHFTEWSDERLEQFIVDMIVPWYFNFFVGWCDVDGILTLTYEDLNRDPFSVLSRIRSHYGISCQDSEIMAAIELVQRGGGTRKNKAIIGRGLTLSERSREQVQRMACYYDGVDFSPLGIGSALGSVVNQRG
jgi:hypothetical protein